MRHLPFVIALLFALLPYDAQIVMIGWLRSLPPDFWYGVLGAALASSIIYSLGWNGLARQLHGEEVGKADEALQRRRR